MYDILGTHASGRPFLFEEFRYFMIDMGIDGMIYDEGSRHFYGIERLVSYVFYGLDHIGDYRTWNPLHIDVSARTDAILAP